MQIPQSNILATNRLGRIFRNTSATYKFFWFISLLQIHAKKKDLKVSVWDLAIRMVANAWYSIHYFRLSFGKSDSLYDIVKTLQQLTNIPIDADSETVIAVLANRISEKQIKETLNTLTLHVPYRFLSPWIKYVSDEDVIVRSQLFENGCLYSLYKDDRDFSVW